MAKRPPSYEDILASYWQEAAKKLRVLIEQPPGGPSVEWTRARAQSQYAQVVRELQKLKSTSNQIAAAALQQAQRDGRLGAQRMIDAMRIPPDLANDVLRPNFALIDTRTVEVIARDTAADIARSIDSTQKALGKTLHAMADNGLKVEEVNRLIAGGVIEGKPAQPIRELRERLKKIHNGNVVTVINKNGDPMDFDAGSYAKMVVHTRAREASTIARHERLNEEGIDLVIILGRISKNFCTAYVGKVFSLSGNHPRFPAITQLPSEPPFHPNCSKSTAAFIEQLASPAVLKVGQMDLNDPMLSTQDRNALQRRFQDLQLRGDSEQRRKTIAEDIRARARAAGYEPPPLDNRGNR